MFCSMHSIGMLCMYIFFFVIGRNITFIAFVREQFMLSIRSDCERRQTCALFCAVIIVLAHKSGSFYLKHVSCNTLIFSHPIT